MCMHCDENDERVEKLQKKNFNGFIIGLVSCLLALGVGVILYMWFAYYP